MTDRIDYEGVMCSCGEEIAETTTDMPAKINDGDCIDTIAEKHSSGYERVSQIRVIRHK